MPEHASWRGIKQPLSTLRGSGRSPLLHGLSRLGGVEGGRFECALRDEGRQLAPRGWAYNATLWAPHIEAALSPWAEGGVSATMLDMAYWDAFYTNKKNRLPGP